MNYYNEIKSKLIDNEVYSKVKDYSKERHKVITYFEIGKLLNEAGGKYGDNIIGEYFKKLVIEVGKKYSKRTLFRMKQFYIVFSNEKVSTLSTQLTWSHYSNICGDMCCNCYGVEAHKIKELNSKKKIKDSLEK